MDCSLPGSCVYGIFQARTLEWVVLPFSRGSSRPRDRTSICYSSCNSQAGSLPLAPPEEPYFNLKHTGRGLFTSLLVRSLGFSSEPEFLIIFLASCQHLYGGARAVTWEAQGRRACNRPDTRMTLYSSAQCRVEQCPINLVECTEQLGWVPEEGWDGNKEANMWAAGGCQRQLDLNYDTASGGHPWIKRQAQLHTPSHTKLQLASVSHSQLLILGFTDFLVYVLQGEYRRLGRRKGHGWWGR